MVADNNNLINSAFIINKLDSSFWMIRRVLFKTQVIGSELSKVYLAHLFLRFSEDFS